MMKISAVKNTAYGCLKKCWAESAFISLLNWGIFCSAYIMVLLLGRFTGAHTADTVLPVFSSFPPLFVVLSTAIFAVFYIATAPLYFGIRWFYWQASCGRIMPLSSLFACYSSAESIVKCIKLKLFTDMRKFTVLIFLGGLCVLEFALADRLWSYSGHSAAAAAALILGCVTVTLGLIVIYFIITMKYIPIAYIMADNPYSGIREIFALSRRIVSRRYTFMFLLFMSCIGWTAMCLFVFPVLIVQPIMYMITAVFIRTGMESGDNRPEKRSDDGLVKSKEHQLA